MLTWKLSFAFVLFFASSTAGTDPVEQWATQTQELQVRTRRLEIGQFMSRPDTFKGWNVLDGFGQNLGRVELIVLNRNRTRAYVVIDVHLGNRLIPVPHDAFEVTLNNEFVLYTDRRRLVSAPSYLRGSWPAWSYYWTISITEFWARASRPLIETGFPLPGTPLGTVR